MINLNQGTYGLGRRIDVPEGYTLIINGVHSVVIEGSSPALTLHSGDLLVTGEVKLTNTTDAPTVLVTGGRLVMRDITVEESNSWNQTAFEVVAGTLDLGTEGDQGDSLVENAKGSLHDRASKSADMPISSHYHRVASTPDGSGISQ